ncbi:MAG TPA: PAS domain S-box protein, partial [Flavisolibacter sp.]|nr:PAS domain S-box protein [Flavisolibacter sp.]
LVITEDKSSTLVVFSHIMSGLEVTYFENSFYRKDGSVIPLAWSARWDEDEQIMYCIARDGREKKLIEQQLVEKQKRLQKVQETAKIGGWEYDLLNKRTRWVSDQVYTIYGISRHEYPVLTVEAFRQLVHPDDLDRLTAELSQIDKLQNYFTEHRVVRPDGQIVFVRQGIEVVTKNNIPVLLTGVVQDITSLRLTDQLLIANERRYRSLVHNGFDMINILDGDGNYLYVSDSSYRILGHDPKDLIGCNAFDLIHPDDVVRMAKTFARLYTETMIEEVEPYRFRNSKGEWRWLESKGANMLHDDAINGLVINSRDITDKKIMQERFEKQVKEWQKRMNKASIQAQEKERAQLGRELHDNVNQVLTTVKLYTELCLDGHPDHKLLLEKSTNYLSDCINEIRSISKRLSIPATGEISLEDSIKELVDSLKLTNKLQINLKVVAEPVSISHDIHVGVYRIIQEHMTNILKHAEATSVDIHISVTDTVITATIKDNGKGFNIKANRKGVGISNMQSRADSLNGVLTIDSKQSAGCVLNLSVPREDSIGA